MKVYNEKNITSLHPEIINRLKELREKKNFNPSNYLALKVKLLNTYMEKANLSACVVALSGGIDSAVVLGIVLAASKEKNSPIKKIIPVTLPVESEGAVNQDKAAYRAKELCASWQIPAFEVALAPAFNTLSSLVDSSLNIKGEAWARGQLVSYLRTPTLYYINSLLVQQGFGAVICGTTNKSEGAYLGYVGKASDGMVDLQLISDLYKSEVYSLARELKVVDSILEVKPSGDMFDGRVDEEVFGASYDFVELYHEFLSGEEMSFSEEAQDQFNHFAACLEKLHKYNAHKYLVGSPAVHLDLYKNLVPGSWGQPIRQEKEINLKNLSNFSLTEITLEENKPKKIEIVNYPGATLFKNVLSSEEVSHILNIIEKEKWSKAGSSGYLKDQSGTGSQRLSLVSEKFSQEIFNRLCPYLSEFQILNNEVARLHSIASLLRFIKYLPEGELFPHVDTTYAYHQGKQTLQSMVIYLSQGQTNFLYENLEKTDWTRRSVESEIDFQVKAQAGDILIFEHNRLHESAKTQEEKNIIRTDLVYEWCGK